MRKDDGERRDRPHQLGPDWLVGKGPPSVGHLGGVYIEGRHGTLERFQWVNSPTRDELNQLTHTGNVRYQMKTPYRDGTTRVIFEPLDFIARLAALIPKPRVNLTRYHGVFAPNSAHRFQVTPARRGRGNTPETSGTGPTPAERHAAMTWVQRLKRVFNINIETCRACGGAVKVIACFEDPAVIDKILIHLNTRTPSEQALSPNSRAPPQAALFE